MAIGVGALLLAPRLLPAVGRVLRPVAKEVLRVGIVAYDGARDTFSGAYEAAGDLVAEARVANICQAKSPNDFGNCKRSWLPSVAPCIAREYFNGRSLFDSLGVL